MDNHTIYAASVRQLNGLIAERDALVVALAAKQQQVDGLVVERAELRRQRAELLSQLTIARGTIFDVSSVRDDALDDDDEPDAFENVGGDG